ncbi:MAG: SRPBCC family protein [Verrucomicrobiae bacterium]|nr:SRPBCC family protein [Verrucomicrobiae bacterium]
MTPILLALAIIGLLIIVIALAGQPDEFKVSRSAKISAPPAKVFPHVNELRKWEAWSPWAKLDPNAKTTFEGPAPGAGSAMAWDGNNKIGSGKMTIADSQPDETIRFRLDFQRPMKATNTAEFTFRRDGGQTIVTWSMYGKNSFGGKVFGLFMNCEKMCGGQFEKGLASLTAVAEAK